MTGVNRLCWRWQRTLLCVTLLLSACRLSPASEPAPARAFGLVVPVYNDAGLEQAVTTLKPHLRTKDRFIVVSGNIDARVDTAWVNRAALELRQHYPATPIYGAPRGLANIAPAARELGPTINALVYIYEPNFPNQPEFSWDFDTTLARFGEAGERTRGGGFRAVGKPTGRPLLQESLQSYGWDYGELATTVDELFIQTQTYCKQGAAAFADALDELRQQYGAHAGAPTWIPQVTIDPDAPNGTSVAQARACLAEAGARGVSGAVLWWSPPFAGRAASFIAALNAAGSP